MGGNDVMQTGLMRNSVRMQPAIKYHCKVGTGSAEYWIFCVPNWRNSDLYYEKGEM